MALRSQGISLQRIGDMFGLSRQRVHQIVRLHAPAQ
jgi:DNA-directed RNA polymerase sigma subunit (sigma70/sigma32)